MATTARSLDVAGVSPYVLALCQTFDSAVSKKLAAFKVGQLDIEVRTSADSVWAVIRRPGQGGVALRAAYFVGEFSCKVAKPDAGEKARIEIASTLGEYTVVFDAGQEMLEYLRVTTSLIPTAPTLLPFMPRDLYPLDADDNPLGAVGKVEAQQRGVNSGVLYLHIDEPAFGNVLYFQNLTALNDYFSATKTKPKNVVGGVWPELGYLLPTPVQSDSPATDPLPAGTAVTLSDAILVFRHEAPPHERESARQFLQMLGIAYRLLETPATEYRDWSARAQWTLRDLDKAPEATIKHYGHRYIHPYTAAE